MIRSLLDTDIFSEIIKGKNHKVKRKANAYLLRSGKFTISVLTVIEIVKGFQKKQAHEKMSRFLKEVKDTKIMSLTFPISVVAGQITGDLERVGKPIGFADPLIVAVAMHHNLTLVTGNIKHYQHIQELGYPLELENWKE